MDMELRYLRYFLAVAEELNFARAAKRLRISQPPLSRQIRLLEKQLGVELFYRTKRQVQLTEAGQVFLEEAREILARVEQGVQAAQRASRGEIGRLVVGFEGSFSYDIVPFSIRAYQKRFPNVELIVQEMTTAEQGEALLENRIGVGFIVPPLHHENLVVEALLQEGLILALPETNALATRHTVRLSDLAGESFITGSRQDGCGLYEQVLIICHQAGFSPKIIQETNEIQMMLGFVAAGIGISLLPTSVKDFHRSGVVYRELEQPTPEIGLAMVWHQDNDSPVLQAFLKTVRKFINEIKK